MPVIAGISYEIIRFSGNTDNKIVRALVKPGLMLQKFTTAEPDDSQLEVGIASLKALLDADYDPNLSEEHSENLIDAEEETINSDECENVDKN